MPRCENMTQIKYHKDEPEIPTDLTTRKQWISDLYSHAMWVHGSAASLISISPVYVNPDSQRIEHPDNLNTQFDVWIEAGPMHDLSLDPHLPKSIWTDATRWIPSHDIRLDCGAETLEEALLILYARIQTFYNADGTSKDIRWCVTCEGAEGTFCPVCGFRV